MCDQVVSLTEARARGILRGTMWVWRGKHDPLTQMNGFGWLQDGTTKRVAALLLADVTFQRSARLLTWRRVASLPFWDDSLLLRQLLPNTKRKHGAGAGTRARRGIFRGFGRGFALRLFLLRLQYPLPDILQPTAPRAATLQHGNPRCSGQLHGIGLRGLRCTCQGGVTVTMRICGLGGRGIVGYRFHALSNRLGGRGGPRRV